MSAQPRATATRRVEGRARARPEQTPAAREAPLVVLIAGSGRSGSTLLGDALAQAPGAVHVGELRFLIEEARCGERLCGCGERVADCGLWRSVRPRALPEGSPDARELAAFSAAAMRYRPRSLWRLYRQGRTAAPVDARAARYAAALGRFYESIAEATGASTIVDSSKIALHVQLGARFAGVRAHVVHLVRDPRAMAYSWRRKAIDGVTFDPLRASISWVVSNLAAAELQRGGDGERSRPGYTFVRYEDLMRDPRATVAALAARVGLDAATLPFTGERTLRLRPNHTVAGNPSRFEHGEVALAPDEEWRRGMQRRDRLLAGLPAAPLLRRYGYALRAGS
jgi:sulfotransferase family protein